MPCLGLGHSLWEIGGILWEHQAWEDGMNGDGGSTAEKVLQIKQSLRAGKQLAPGHTAGSRGAGSHFGVSWHFLSLGPWFLFLW